MLGGNHPPAALCHIPVARGRPPPLGGGGGGGSLCGGSGWASIGSVGSGSDGAGLSVSPSAAAPSFEERKRIGGSCPSLARRARAASRSPGRVPSLGSTILT